MVPWFWILSEPKLRSARVGNSDRRSSIRDYDISISDVCRNCILSRDLVPGKRRPMCARDEATTFALMFLKTRVWDYVSPRLSLLESTRDQWQTVLLKRRKKKDEPRLFSSFARAALKVCRSGLGHVSFLADSCHRNLFLDAYLFIYLLFISRHLHGQRAPRRALWPGKGCPSASYGP